MTVSKINMIRNIQQLSFAVHETVLFLNCHPTCKKALAYYNKQNKALKEAVEAYERNFGALTQNGVYSETDWTWAKGPWPWEYEANFPQTQEVRTNVALR